MERVTGPGGAPGRVFIVPNPSDRDLALSFIRMQEEGLDRMVWFEPSGPPSLAEFLVGHRHHGVYCCYWISDVQPDTYHLAGMCWAHQRMPVGDGAKYEVGMAFFREFQNTEACVLLAQLCVTHIFEQDAILLVGTTPVKNRAAARFIEKVGLEKVGEIPMYLTYEGQPCTAIISAVTADYWRATWAERARQKGKQEP